MEKTKVMIVDDEPDFLRMVKLNLEATDKYEVLTLSKAKNIVSEVHNFKPDIILIDLLMPVIGGIEACEMLNKDPIGKDTPIIIVSALEKDQDKLKAYKEGVVDYLTKPIENDFLISRIEKALRFKRGEAA
jgi:two-component system alkaline phosphatase synthesis response regulator PhoP